MISGAVLGFLVTFWLRKASDAPRNWPLVLPTVVALTLCYMVFQILLLAGSGRDPSGEAAIGAYAGAFALSAGATLRMEQKTVDMAISGSWLFWSFWAYILLVFLGAVFRVAIL